jgi:hypothetical protein
MNVKFKNVGWFIEENSARYEANINNLFVVRVWKCPYHKGFRFSFLTVGGFSLDRINDDYLSTFWDRATKQEAHIRINDILNDRECYDAIVSKSNSVTEQMNIHFKSLDRCK